jgi:hypothetical protein
MGRRCKDCEEPISAERLKEMPNTKFCTPCGEKREQHPEPKSRENPENLTRNKDTKAERERRRVAQLIKDHGIG